jgi:hypothetical protein
MASTAGLPGSEPMQVRLQPTGMLSFSRIENLTDTTALRA